MVGGAAGDDDDAPAGGEELVGDRAEVAEVHAVAARGAVGDRFGHRVGLLMDLLEHERLVAALLGHFGAPVDVLDGALDARAVGLHEHDVVGRDHHDLVVLDQLDVARVGEEGRNRRAEEVLALAAADDERALLAGGDDEARLVRPDGDEGVVAPQPAVGQAHGFSQAVAVEQVRDEVGDDLGVGLRREDGAVGLELLLELHVVLDDPVDDDVDAVVRVEVRVRVGLRDAAVGGPAGVADARAGRRGEHRHTTRAGALLASGDGAPEVAQVADRTDGVKPVLALEGDARRVVAAVFEHVETGQDDLLRGALPGVSHDSAHGRSPSRSKWTGGRRAAPTYERILEPCGEAFTPQTGRSARLRRRHRPRSAQT